MVFQLRAKLIRSLKLQMDSQNPVPALWKCSWKYTSKLVEHSWKVSGYVVYAINVSCEQNVWHAKKKQWLGATLRRLLSHAGLFFSVAVSGLSYFCSRRGAHDPAGNFAVTFRLNRSRLAAFELHALEVRTAMAPWLCWVIFVRFPEAHFPKGTLPKWHISQITFPENDTFRGR